jgi:cytochrome c oxidase subunit I+III
MMRETHVAPVNHAVIDDTRLHEVWGGKPGIIGWLSNLDHKAIGKRYIVTAFIFFILGGLEAAAMRWQLAKPENAFLDADLYNQMFTMHGTTMMFLFGVPVQIAVAVYLTPLILGTRNVAFPRLNAYGYYTYVVGGLLLYAGFLFNSAPDSGWFSYVPLAGPQYSAGKRIDIWAQTVTFTEIAALSGAVTLIVTILKQRAPGMSLNRLPIYLWAVLVTMFVILFAMPSVALASIMLAFDRLVGTHFFNQAEGGDPLLWQHLFWFFGHPEVYIMFIPAAGFASHMVSVFSGRRMFGYTAVALSMIATGFLSFGLWVHHMFTTGLPQLGQSFFTAASLLIVVPNGIQVFCWIATLWAGRPRFTTPLLFTIGFIILFIIGGLTGVMVASVPFDQQAHDTYFIVAHLHYVQIGAFVFPLFAAIYYWFPKITGRMLSEKLGKLNFWLFFIGMNVTFFPMHFLGLQGMTRRVYTYLPETGWAPLNQLATAGAAIIAISMIIFLFNVFRSLRSGVVAGDDPWGSYSLEWATTSPPPVYNFRDIPVVQGLYALWDRTSEKPVATGLTVEKPEVLLTTVMDAIPNATHTHPAPSVWPVLAAIATGAIFITSIFTPWGYPIGGALLFVGLVGWFWKRPPYPATDEAEKPA